MFIFIISSWTFSSFGILKYTRYAIFQNYLIIISYLKNEFLNNTFLVESYYKIEYVY